MEKRVKAVLKKLEQKGKIDQVVFEKVKPIGSKPGKMYGLAKIHKALVNGIPKFRPILSSIGTATYNLAKFLVPIMTPITTNEFTVSDSFKFGKDILQQDCSLFMGSLDVESLFTSIPLTETINICADNLFQQAKSLQNLSKSDFKALLTSACKESLFLFNGQFYSQTDGVSMGSPLGPTLANAFMCHHEKVWIETCPADFRPKFYRRYVDDIFVLFEHEEQLDKFKDFLNGYHPSLKFTSEKECDGKMPFLDFSIFREGGKFSTKVYRKSTFTGLYTNYNSLIPKCYKFGLVLTLLHRIFAICSSYQSLHEELEKIKLILRKNAYPLDFIYFAIRKFLLGKLGSTEKIVDLKKPVRIVLPFLGKISMDIKNDLLAYSRKILPSGYKLQVIFKGQNTISRFFRYKDKIPYLLNSHLVYQYKCSCCRASYIGYTRRHIKTRWSEHMGVSPYTGALVVGQIGVVRDHMLTCQTKIKIDNFKILETDNLPTSLRIKESLLIQKFNPSLNKDDSSTPLLLF